MFEIRVEACNWPVVPHVHSLLGFVGNLEDPMKSIDESAQAIEMLPHAFPSTPLSMDLTF